MDVTVCDWCIDSLSDRVPRPSSMDVTVCVDWCIDWCIDSLDGRAPLPSSTDVKMCVHGVSHFKVCFVHVISLCVLCVQHFIVCDLCIVLL